MYNFDGMSDSNSNKSLIERIKQLKKKKNALILCHNYQRPEIYAIGDLIGDSLELCKKARDLDAGLIVFCGVKFMAESAAVLNPKAKVLIPTLNAGCALADMATTYALINLKKKHPRAGVVCYVNSSVEIKAFSDACCTSSNAVKVIENMSEDEIIFLPDRNLASFVAKKVKNKKIIAWDGYCPVHERLSAEYLIRAKNEHPGAEIIAHPECREEILEIADHVASTSGMVKIAEESSAKEFICTTECGMLERLKTKVPGKSFHSVCSVCFDMKKITLEMVAESLEDEKFVIEIPKDLRIKALSAFNRMFELIK